MRIWITPKSFMFGILAAAAVVACSTPTHTPTQQPSNTPSSPPSSTPSSSPSSSPSQPPQQGCGPGCTCAIDLSWEAPPESTDPVAQFVVFQSLNNAGYAPIDQADQPILNTTASIPDVCVGTYCYYVKSEDAQENFSAPSNTVCLNITSTTGLSEEVKAQLSSGFGAHVRNQVASGSVGSIPATRAAFSPNQCTGSRNDMVAEMMQKMANNDPAVRRIISDPKTPKVAVMTATYGGEDVRKKINDACEGMINQCEVSVSDLATPGTSTAGKTFSIEWFCVNRPENGIQSMSLPNPSPDSIIMMNCSN